MEGERYLIGGDVFLAWPEVAASSPIGAELLVAEETLNSLRTSTELGFVAPQIFALIMKSVDAGILRLIPREPPEWAGGAYRGRVVDYDWWDDTLVRTASRCGAVVVSDEAMHRKIATEYGTPIIGGAELLGRITSPPPLETLLVTMRAATVAVRRNALLGLLATVIVIALVAYIYRLALSLTNFPQPWWLAAGVATAGVLLFAMRLRMRLAYGAAEIVAGILTGWNVASRLTTDASRFSIALQLLAAVYIVVRGLDNVATGWPDSSARILWRRFVGPYRTA